MMKNHLPKDYKCCCIRCDREIKSCDKDDIFPPSKAMAFFTSGNYGTSLFDAPLVDRGELCIFLCDDCGSKMKDCIIHIHSEVEKKTTYQTFQRYESQMDGDEV